LDALDWRRRIPPKIDIKGWNELRAYLAGTDQKLAATRRTLTGLDKFKQIEKKIAALGQPHTLRKKEKLKELKFEKRTVVKEYKLRGKIASRSSNSVIP
jgi:hypothetical protein